MIKFLTKTYKLDACIWQFEYLILSTSSWSHLTGKYARDITILKGLQLKSQLILNQVVLYKPYEREMF